MILSIHCVVIDIALGLTFISWIKSTKSTKIGAHRKYDGLKNSIKFVYILWNTFTFHMRAGNVVQIS